MLACALLTYGGVSLFVVAFSVYPIAISLFREADDPEALHSGGIGLGSFTFTMMALPGTPAIQNAIPMPFFGTTAFAAPGLGVIAAMFMFGFGHAVAQSPRGRGQGEGRGLRRRTRRSRSRVDDSNLPSFWRRTAADPARDSA